MTSSRLRIFEQFSMDRWPEMDGFIAETHGRGHIMRNRDLFEWCFLRNYDENMANVLVAYDHEKLVSLLGFMPTLFNWGNNTIEGAWMAHWFTLQDYRRGIGSLLMRKMTEMFPIVAGQGASDMNREIVRKMGFHFLEKIQRVICILDPDATEKAFCLKPGALKEAGIEASSTKFRHGGERKVVRVERKLLAAEYDPHWPSYPDLRFSTLRDRAYLNFRYITYPFFEYIVLIAGKPKSPAVGVIRIEKTRGIAEVFAGRILEFFYPSTPEGQADAETILAESYRIFSQSECVFLDFYSSSRKINTFLCERGFWFEEGPIIPSRLNPIQLKYQNQNLELSVSRELSRDSDFEFKDFFVTKGDGDQDRPNYRLEYRG